jgi:hypothetical protein
MTAMGLLSPVIDVDNEAEKGAAPVIIGFSTGDDNNAKGEPSERDDVLREATGTERGEEMEEETDEDCKLGLVLGLRLD